jgi:hypothetical protein
LSCAEEKGTPRKHSRSNSLLEGLRKPGEKEESLYELLKKEESREKEEWNKLNHTGETITSQPLNAVASSHR